VKILHVVPTYIPAWKHGGPIRSVHGLCKALAARGHQVTVFTTDVDTEGAVPTGQAVQLDGVEVWYFPVAAPRRLYRSPQMDAALRSRIAGFDVVHLHSVFLWPTAAAARAAERAGVPYLLAPRGMLVPDLLKRRGRWRKAAWIRFVEKRTLARAAGLHATADLEAEEARRLGLPLPPIFIVPNGIDAEPPIAPPAAPIRDLLAGPPVLLYLGRLSWKKGLDRLIPALARVPDAHLALAGNDEEGIRPRLEALTREAGVAGRVVFLGPVDGADKAALLHGCAALVLPSYSENFGNAVLEAMAAGRPVAVTPEVGLAGVVREERAGIVADGDSALLGDALRNLLADPDREAMGQRGADAARRRFGWEAVAVQMEGVYRGLVRA
jgi:glycosyltransferase involved in cell wall biosynthesis